MNRSACIDSPLRGRAMPKSYSGDLRERVIEAVEGGASRRETAERFEVSVSSAVKWLQRWHESKSAVPKPRGGSVSPGRVCGADTRSDCSTAGPDLWRPSQSCASDRFEPAVAHATLRYLPKYSPDLNPIELPYSKFKAFLRKVAARTVPGLTRAIRSFVPQLGPRECANYFRHAGYARYDRNPL